MKTDISILRFYDLLVLFKNFLREKFIKIFVIVFHFLLS